MDAQLKLWEQPAAEEIYMLAGWRQWADAGNVSSGLPQYLIEKLGARQIGEIVAPGCYLFQVPGTHHFLRPEIKLVEGYRAALRRPHNDLYYVESDRKGLVIFLGDEPHLNVDDYAAAVIDAAQQLGARRVVALGGVYAPVPCDRARQVSCSYSLPRMKDDLARYAVSFSDYEGGVTISSYLLDRAEHAGLELAAFYALAPAYDFSELSEHVAGIRVDSDFRAWYELMQRLNYMFDLWVDLSDLRQQSEELTAALAARIEALVKSAPKLKIRAFLDKLAADFTETPFLQLDQVWEQELRDLLDRPEGADL